MEQTEGVSLIRRVIADALGQGQTGHGHILGGIPEAVEGDDGLICQLAPNGLRIDQVDHRVAAQQVNRLLNRGDTVGQAEKRRINQFK